MLVSCDAPSIGQDLWQQHKRLERTYGGKRRQIAIYSEELEKFRQIAGNAKDHKSFADFLDIAIINFQGAGQHYDLGDGSLHTKLQQKLPDSS